ncbi:sugar phosphate isomerase/epimerase [Candidatus Poribacteria bacterium]|nr:sugar phosphate isomerase/epimerase [Candidatus Poribacteria bacterium]
MRFGIRDGMLRVPLEQQFAKAKELGFDGIEICLGGNYQASPLFSEAGIDQLRALSDASGVAVSSFSPGGFTSYTYLHPDDERRTEGLRMLNHLSRVAPEFGVKVILVPFFGDGTIPAERSLDPRLVDGLKRTGEVAGKYGVTLGIESTLSGEQHHALVHAVRLSSVGVYYDMGNATNYGYDSPAEIRSLGPHIAQIHMKDLGGKHLGEGGVDFDAVGAAIRDIGYDQWLVLETPTGDVPDEGNRRNLAFTQALAS